MKVLIIVATKAEIEPLLNKMDSYEEDNLEDVINCKYKKLNIFIHVAGVGMVLTSMISVEAGLMSADYNSGV